MVLEEQPKLGACLCKVKKQKNPYPVMSFRIQVLSDDSLAKFFPNDVGCGIERSQFSHWSIMYWLYDLGQITEPLWDLVLLSVKWG